MKKFFLGLFATLLVIVSVNALLPRDIKYMPAVFYRDVVIGRGDLNYPDSCAHLQVGKDSSRKGFLLTPTDTSLIPKALRKQGLMVALKSDSGAVWRWTGKRWLRASQ